MPQVSRAHVLFLNPVDSRVAHLRQLLVFEGIDVSVCAADDLRCHAARAPQLVVLDDESVRGGALAIAQVLATTWAERPLTLALVSAGREFRGVELVEGGVDGFLTVPCGSREFVARVRAMLRRVSPADDARPAFGQMNAVLRVRQLDIDPARRRVRADGRELKLTEQEFQLLYFLAGHPGRVFDRQTLLDAVWGTDTFVTSRSVDALVKRLRHQLRPVLGGRIVETVRGVGYRLADVAPATPPA